MRMALEDLVENPKYDFVVLQATPSSLSFYERFGFVRVGAVCRYATNPNSVVGYRHWTYKDEKHLSKVREGGGACGTNIHTPPHITPFPNPSSLHSSAAWRTELHDGHRLENPPPKE